MSDTVTPDWSLNNPVGSETLQGGQSTPYQPGSGINFTDLAKALKDSGLAGGGGNQAAQLSNVAAQAGQAPAAPMAQSGAYNAARPISLDNLVQMLMARVNAYQTGSNPATARPVLGAQSRQTGLLGL